MWTVKAAAILAGRDQPPVLFEAAPLFFALALVALRTVVTARDRIETIGAASAYLATALAAPTAVAALVAWNEDMPAVFNGTLAAAVFALVVALVVVGIAIRRERALGRSWSPLPLSLGVAFVPLVLVGGLLSLVEERLLEIPIAFLGFAWALLGYAIATSAMRRC